MDNNKIDSSFLSFSRLVITSDYFYLLITSDFLLWFANSLLFTDYFCFLFLLIIADMVLCQVFDPLTGVYVWSTEPPSLRTSINDLHTDMLVDHGRNRSYDEAIGKAIWLKLSQLPADQGTLQVLDIGTGTGLLSLMAARHACRWFAAHSASSASIRVKITGCEIVGAMAQLAQAIVQRNRHLFEIYPIEIQVLRMDVYVNICCLTLNLFIFLRFFS